MTERSKPCKERGSGAELLEAEQFLILGCYVGSQPLDPGCDRLDVICVHGMLISTTTLWMTRRVDVT